MSDDVTKGQPPAASSINPEDQLTVQIQGMKLPFLPAKTKLFKGPADKVKSAYIYDRSFDLAAQIVVLAAIIVAAYLGLPELAKGMLQAAVVMGHAAQSLYHIASAHPAQVPIR